MASRIRIDKPAMLQIIQLIVKHSNQQVQEWCRRKWADAILMNAGKWTDAGKCWNGVATFTKQKCRNIIETRKTKIESFATIQKAASAIKISNISNASRFLLESSKNAYGSQLDMQRRIRNAGRVGQTWAEASPEFCFEGNSVWQVCVMSLLEALGAQPPAIWKIIRKISKNKRKLKKEIQKSIKLWNNKI